MGSVIIAAPKAHRFVNGTRSAILVDVLTEGAFMLGHAVSIACTSSALLVLDDCALVVHPATETGERVDPSIAFLRIASELDSDTQTAFLTLGWRYVGDDASDIDPRFYWPDGARRRCMSRDAAGQLCQHKATEYRLVLDKAMTYCTGHAARIDAIDASRDGSDGDAREAAAYDPSARRR
jgi:hypothetical protein